jgi:hypothetical protein
VPLLKWRQRNTQISFASALWPEMPASSLCQFGTIYLKGRKNHGVLPFMKVERVLEVGDVA